MLAAGSVIYLEVAFRQGDRNKYLVVLDVDTKVHTLTVNTEINPFFGLGEFGKCYVEIDQHSHQFLDHNSFIDCNQIIKLNLPDVIAEMRSNSDCVKGSLSNDVVTAVIAAIQRTPGISPHDKSHYCGCLTR